MNKILLTPDTTLYPVSVVLITCGEGNETNIITVNRIASCNAEPPMLSVSVRPARASHDLILRTGEFVVNIPWPEQALIADYAGVTTMRKTNKWQDLGISMQPAVIVKPPLIADCPVNLECALREQIKLPSHTLFIAEVVQIHAVREILDANRKVDLQKARGGLMYRSAVVRERPVENIQPESLLSQIKKRP